MRKKKLNHYKHIPFKEPQDMNIYMKLWRSNEPEELAVELGIVDDKKIKKLAKLLFGVFLIIYYYDLIYYLTF